MSILPDGCSADYDLDAIELLEAAAARPEAAVKQALTQLQGVLADPANPLAKWMPALEGGDAANGFALFQALPAGQCLRCHRASTDSHAAGGEAGPNLAGIAKRGDRRYLLESVVQSSAVVVSGYGSVNLDLANGGALTGTLLQEKPDFVDVDVAGNRWRVARQDIKAMTAPVSGMPALDGEIERDDWIVLSALPSDVLAEPRVDLWAQVLRRQPMPLPMLATHPIDLSRN